MKEACLAFTRNCAPDFRLGFVTHMLHTNKGIMWWWLKESRVPCLLPEWNDCTAYIFNDFKKQDLDAQFGIYLGFSVIHTGSQVNIQPQIYTYIHLNMRLLHLLFSCTVYAFCGTDCQRRLFSYSRPGLMYEIPAGFKTIQVPMNKARICAQFSHHRSALWKQSRNKEYCLIKL